MILTGTIKSIRNPINTIYPKIAIIQSEQGEIPVGFYSVTTPIAEDFLKIGDEVTLQLQVRCNSTWNYQVELAVYRLEEILKVKRTVTITSTIMENGEKIDCRY